MFTVLRDELPTLVTALGQVTGATMGAIIGAIGTLVAVYVGVRVGFAKFKYERVFDRQLGWYERTLGLLHQIRMRNRLLMAALDSKDVHSLTTIQAELHGLIEQFFTCLSEASLYTSQETLVILRTLKDELEHAALHAAPMFIFPWWHRYLPPLGVLAYKRMDNGARILITTFEQALNRAIAELEVDGRRFFEHERRERR